MIFAKKTQTFNGKQLTDIVNGLLKIVQKNAGFNDPVSRDDFHPSYLARTTREQIALLEDVGLTALEFQEILTSRTGPKTAYELGFLINNLTYAHFEPCAPAGNSRGE